MFAREHIHFIFLLGVMCGAYTLANTVKLLNNGHPFCRGLVAVVDECLLIWGCGKMSTNPRVEMSKLFN